MAKYNVLILGASYGSLLATKLAMAGHDVTLVCLPAEEEAINRDGALVRLPVKGRGAVEIRSKTLPGKVSADGPGAVNPADYDLVGLAMQEPQYRSAGVRELMEAVAKAKVPCMSIMNMPPLTYLKRIPGLDTGSLTSAYTDPTVWQSFDPAYMTLCSPDPQAFRPPDEPVNVLQVTLPTNFKVARFKSDKHTTMLRDMQAGIEAMRYDVGGDEIELPVKLKVHDSVFVPLAKWAMLLTGNYRCVTKAGPRSIKEAVHTDPRGIARRLRLGARSLHQPRSLTRRSRAVREICRCRSRARASVLCGPRPVRRARPTSSASTASCRPSRRRRACATRSWTRPLHWWTKSSQPIAGPQPNKPVKRTISDLFGREAADAGRVRVAFDQGLIRRFRIERSQEVKLGAF